jgi:AraC-like DNA-binding protein
MRMIVRQPSPALRPFVSSIWYYEGDFPHSRERMLPTGTMALLVNLAEDELRTYEGEGYATVERTRGAALCGAYDRHFAIDTAEQRSILGVSFHPGGTLPFFREPASAVRDLHVPLDALWSDGAGLRARLLDAASDDDRLRLIETLLREHVVRPLEPDEAMAFAVTALERGASVADVRDRLGATPARFIARFADAVGLTPKRFARLRRFQRVLRALDVGAGVDWADVAAAGGFADQAHLVNEFRAFAGITPTQYRPREPGEPNHVPLSDDAFASSRPAPAPTDRPAPRARRSSRRRRPASDSG